MSQIQLSKVSQKIHKTSFRLSKTEKKGNITSVHHSSNLVVHHRQIHGCPATAGTVVVAQLCPFLDLFRVQALVMGCKKGWLKALDATSLESG